VGQGQQSAQREMTTIIATTDASAPADTGTGGGPSTGGQAAPTSRLDTAGLRDSGLRFNRIWASRQRIANTIVSRRALTTNRRGNTAMITC